MSAERISTSTLVAIAFIGPGGRRMRHQVQAHAAEMEHTALAKAAGGLAVGMAALPDGFKASSNARRSSAVHALLHSARQLR